MQSRCERNLELASVLNPIALGVELEPVLFKLAEIAADAGEGDSNIKKNVSVYAKHGASG